MGFSSSLSIEGLIELPRFLLPHLQINRLCNQTNLKAVRTTMTVMPKGVFEFYDDVLRRIEDQPNDDKALAKKALAYIFCARRLLSLPELSQMLAVEAGDTDLDSNASPEPEILLTVCAGLITIDEQGTTVRFNHSTVQEHLETHGDKFFHEPEVKFSQTCLTYLSFTVFNDGPSTSEQKLQKRLQDYPLLEYASRFWGDHLIAIQLHENVAPLLTRFLDEQKKLASAVQILFLPQRQSENRYNLFPKQHTALHQLAYWGLDQTMSNLLHTISDIDHQDSYGTTALMLAAKNGHDRIVDLLLQKGAEIDKANNREETALYWAARNVHERTVDLLLTWGADVLSKDCEGWTALDWAALGSDGRVVKLLLSNGVSSSEGRERALLLAAEEGHEQTVQVLLETGVDVNARDYLGSTPLDWAVPSGHETTVAVLLRNGANAMSKDAYGNSAAHWATPYPATMRLLLDRGIEVDAVNDRGQTPLIWAAQDGYADTVRLLLQKNAKINAQDIYGFTPLHRATLRGRGLMVCLLLEKGADPNFRNEDGWTPLHIAAIKRDEQLVERLRDRVDQGKLVLARLKSQFQDADTQALMEETAERKAEANTAVAGLSATIQYRQMGRSQLLIERGVDVNEKGVGGWTPLIIAASLNRLEGVQLLLDNGADVDIGGFDHRTALHWASERGHEKVVQLLVKHQAGVNLGAHTWTAGLLAAQGGHVGVLHILIENGANVNAKDYHGRTALHWAVKHDSGTMLQTLADNGADLNTTDRWGRTPLMWSIEHRKEVSFLLLLKLGVDVQKGACHAITALHVAVFLEWELAVQALLAAGADPDAEARWTDTDEEGEDNLKSIDAFDESVIESIRRLRLGEGHAHDAENSELYSFTVRQIALYSKNLEVQKLLEAGTSTW